MRRRAGRGRAEDSGDMSVDNRIIGSFLALIPARGGSKGVPRKNLHPLAGRPLLAHTIEAARAARLVSRVVVTTDSREIARAARKAGAEVPFMRPATLARDDTPTLDAVRHALAWLEKHEGYLPDGV